MPSVPPNIRNRVPMEVVKEDFDMGICVADLVEALKTHKPDAMVCMSKNNSLMVGRMVVHFECLNDSNGRVSIYEGRDL